MDRSQALLEIRPKLNIPNGPHTTVEEKFQNDTLRPILKLQHDYLCSVFLKSPFILKQKFENKSPDQQRNIIVESLKANNKLKAQIIHSVVGLFTLEEFDHFMQHQSEYQKRIIAMATERIINGVVK